MKRILVIVGALLLSVGAVIAQQDVVKQTQTDDEGKWQGSRRRADPDGQGRQALRPGGGRCGAHGTRRYRQEAADHVPGKHQGSEAEGDYSSSPKIWEDKAGFDAKIASFAKVVTEAKAKIKDLDTLKATFPAIGKECGGCHETFRLKNS